MEKGDGDANKWENIETQFSAKSIESIYSRADDQHLISWLGELTLH